MVSGTEITVHKSKGRNKRDTKPSRYFVLFRKVLNLYILIKELVFLPYEASFCNPLSILLNVQTIPIP